MRQNQNRGIRHRALPLAGLIAFTVVASALSGLTACGDDPARECRVGADCASGACGVDGQCVRGDAGANGSETGAGTDTDAAPAGEGGTPDAATDAAINGCSPNKDGTITRAEVPIAAGLHATYRIGTNEDIATAGTTRPDGKRDWDFTAPLASDVSVLVETQPLAGKWYASKFAGASYATKLQEGSDLIGVFETSPGAVLLRGVVSPTEGVKKTELTNTPPVSVLAFPLKMGSKWNTDTAVSGTAQGLALFGTYSEKYTSEVDAAGDLKTPLGTFQVLRVRSQLTRQIGILTPTTLRTFAFVTECYGTIATVRSADNETNVEFTRAAEIRRISP